MRLWFEEPYESLDELTSLYDKHIHDTHERRFVVDLDGIFAGIVELVSIDYIHRNCEIQIVITDKFSGLGYAQQSLKKKVLIMHSIRSICTKYICGLMSIMPKQFIYTKSSAFRLKERLNNNFFCWW